MTVRMTRTESGSTTQSTDPHTVLPSALPEAPPAGTDGTPRAPSGARSGGGGELIGDPEQADPEPRADGRRAQRAARQQRRRISMACALLIAVCLVITILIVAVARNRAPGAEVVVPPSALAAPEAIVVSRPGVPTTHPNQLRGAPAPEGGTLDFNQFHTGRRAS